MCKSIFGCESSEICPMDHQTHVYESFAYGIRYLLGWFSDSFIFRGNEAEVPSDKSVLNLLITGVPIRPFRSRVGFLQQVFSVCDS